MRGNKAAANPAPRRFAAGREGPAAKPREGEPVRPPPNPLTQTVNKHLRLKSPHQASQIEGIYDDLSCTTQS